MHCMSGHYVHDSHLEVVHEAVVAFGGLADWEVVAQITSRGEVATGTQLNSVVVVPSGVSNDRHSCRESAQSLCYTSRLRLESFQCVCSGLTNNQSDAQICYSSDEDGQQRSYGKSRLRILINQEIFVCENADCSVITDVPDTRAYLQISRDIGSGQNPSSCREEDGKNREERFSISEFREKVFLRDGLCFGQRWDVFETVQELCLLYCPALHFQDLLVILTLWISTDPLLCFNRLYKIKACKKFNQTKNKSSINRLFSIYFQNA